MSSIGEIAMLVNDNFSKPLNIQMRELKYSGSYLITNSMSFSPEKTGWYKVICVGRAGNSRCVFSSMSGYICSTGGAGGVAISTLLLEKSTIYDIIVNSSVSSFGNIEALCGSDASGGKASGGDFNYEGNSGRTSESKISTGVDVGVYIPELMRSFDSSGQGILGYGASVGAAIAPNDIEYPPIRKGCVLIIPLELEE